MIKDIALYKKSSVYECFRWNENQNARRVPISHISVPSHGIVVSVPKGAITCKQCENHANNAAQKGAYK